MEDVETIASAQQLLTDLKVVEGYLADHIKNAKHGDGLAASQLRPRLDLLIHIISSVLEGFEATGRQIDAESSTVLNGILQRIAVSITRLKFGLEDKYRFGGQKRSLAQWSVLRAQKFTAKIDSITNDLILWSTVYGINAIKSNNESPQAANDISDRLDANGIDVVVSNRQSLQAPNLISDRLDADAAGQATHYIAGPEIADDVASNKYRSLAFSKALQPLDFQPLNHYAITVVPQKASQSVPKLAVAYCS